MEKEAAAAALDCASSVDSSFSLARARASEPASTMGGEEEEGEEEEEEEKARNQR